MRALRSLRWQVFLGCFGLTAMIVVAFAIALHVQRGVGLLAALDRELLARIAAIAGLCEWEDGGVQFGGGEAPADPRQQVLQQAVVATWPARAFVAGDRQLLAALPTEPGVGPTFVEATASRLCVQVCEVPARAAEAGEPPQPAFAVLVAAAADTTPIVRDLAALRLSLLGVGACVLVCAAAIASWLAARVTQPVGALVAAAQRTHAGQRQPMPRGGSREIDALADAFDGALARLDEARERQSRFAADASHELRTPIAIVRAQAEVLQLQAHDATQCRNGLDSILAAAGRMAATVEALLLLARADAGAIAEAMEPCDLAAIVRAEITTMAAAGGDASAITLDAVAAATVRGHAELLRTLVGNLLRNAAQHAGHSGPIRISVARANAVVELVVMDSGPGIAAELLPRVFERFFRADDSRSRLTGGAGLGLSLVKAIADLHGAPCAITSMQGQGTTVRVLFAANVPEL